MKDSEIVKRLIEFAIYLDNLPSGKDKATLSKFFVGYNELSNKYHYEKYKNKYIEKGV